MGDQRFDNTNYTIIKHVREVLLAKNAACVWMNEQIVDFIVVELDHVAAHNFVAVQIHNALAPSQPQLQALRCAFSRRVEFSPYKNKNNDCSRDVTGCSH